MSKSALKTAVAILLALCCAVGPATVFAQDGDRNVAQRNGAEKSDPTEAYDSYFMSPEHREKLYQQNRKSAGKAVLLTLAFPGLGNIYAEQYMFAGVAIVFMVFAATFVGYGISTKQNNIIMFGAVTAGIAYSGGGVLSVHGVNVFNRKLREGLKVEGATVQEKWTPMLTLRF